MVELISGATGFIGSNLVRSFIKKNRKIRLLVRKDLDLKKNIEIFKGDLLDIKSLKKATKDVKVVYHTAGMLGNGVSYTQLYKANVLATENLVKASVLNGVSRFVHISSVAAMGKVKQMADEAVVCNPLTDYDRSKYQSEMVLDKYKNKIDIVILRPTMVYGPGETRNKAKLFQLIQEGYFTIIGKGNNLMSILYIDNLIDAILLASSKGKPNEVYIISDKRPYTMNEFVCTIAKELGVKKPKHIPLWLAKLGALFFKLSRIVGIKPLLTLDRINNLTSNHSFDITKARKKLGYEPRIDLKEGVKRTIEWYKNEDILD
jgi:nucleoside-diphosphate-sugar epimerase